MHPPCAIPSYRAPTTVSDALPYLTAGCRPPPPLPDAVQMQGKDLKVCMAEKPTECESFRYALFQCRKGQVDARTRIQGNKGY